MKVIQGHHLIYENLEHKQDEITVKVYKGEHLCLTRMNWMKNHSKGMMKALRLYLLLYEDEADEL